LSLLSHRFYSVFVCNNVENDRDSPVTRKMDDSQSSR